MSWTPENGDYVLFRGNEIVLSAFGRDTILGSAVLTGVNHQWGRAETIADNNGCVIAHNKEATLNLTFRCYGTTEGLARRSMIERICAGLSVRELLSIVNSRLREREKT